MFVLLSRYIYILILASNAFSNMLRVHFIAMDIFLALPLFPESVNNNNNIIIT